MSTASGVACDERTLVLHTWTQDLRRHVHVHALMACGALAQQYAKTPLAGPAVVLDYLSRYTHRTAIGNERLVALDDTHVRWRVRADGRGGKRTVALEGEQFIARFLQHVLPAGFKRIRHYGLLAPAAKAQRLGAARALLAMPTPNPQAIEDAQAFMRRVAALEIGMCCLCKVGRLKLVWEVPPQLHHGLAGLIQAYRGAAMRDARNSRNARNSPHAKGWPDAGRPGRARPIAAKGWFARRLDPAPVCAGLPQIPPGHPRRAAPQSSSTLRIATRRT